MKWKRQFQPHDAFFKQFMSHPETAKDLLDIHLPVELREICDLTTFKLESGSFIEEKNYSYDGVDNFPWEPPTLGKKKWYHHIIHYINYATN